MLISDGLLNSAIAEATGGAVAGAIADTVLYGIDSAKVRTQSTPVAGSGNVSILFRGLGPTVLLGSVPVFGTFFILYAPIRDILNAHNQREFLPLASAACAVPATIVGVPADVLKKRLVLGIDKNVKSALSNVVAENGGIIRGLFAGWHVNLIKDIPFAGVKIGLYEFFVHQYQKLYGLRATDHISPIGAGICGVLSGVSCAIVTCPLDVVNTRIKAGTTKSSSIFVVSSEIAKKEGIRALFRGVVMRSFVLGIGSSIFWPIQRTVAQGLKHQHEEPKKRYNSRTTRKMTKI